MAFRTSRSPVGLLICAKLNSFANREVCSLDPLLMLVYFGFNIWVVFWFLHLNHEVICAWNWELCVWCEHVLQLVDLDTHFVCYEIWFLSCDGSLEISPFQINHRYLVGCSQWLHFASFLHERFHFFCQSGIQRWLFFVEAVHELKKVGKSSTLKRFSRAAYLWYAGH